MLNFSQIILAILLGATLLTFAVSLAAEKTKWIVISSTILGLYFFGSIYTWLFSIF